MLCSGAVTLPSRHDKITVHIKIKNLTIAQSIALEDMLATWQQLGGLGASRWTSFFADGDGNFHPKVLYNGHKPNKTELLDEDDVWKGSDYRIDFDSIAWKLHDREDVVILESKKAKWFRVWWGSFIDNISSFRHTIKRGISLQHFRRKYKCLRTVQDENTRPEQLKSEDPS